MLRRRPRFAQSCRRFRENLGRFSKTATVAVPSHRPLSAGANGARRLAHIQPDVGDSTYQAGLPLCPRYGILLNVLHVNRRARQALSQHRA